jgi:hypothetical protein
MGAALFYFDNLRGLVNSGRHVRALCSRITQISLCFASITTNAPSDALRLRAIHAPGVCFVSCVSVFISKLPIG